MKRGEDVYLQDIIESAALIEEYIRDVSKETFVQDIGIQDKVIRRLEVIGEAVKHIPEETRSEHPDIPWREIAGMRDILTHEYFGLELPRIWKTAVEDVPALRERVQQMRESR